MIRHNGMRFNPRNFRIAERIDDIRKRLQNNFSETRIQTPIKTRREDKRDVFTYSVLRNTPAVKIDIKERVIKTSEKIKREIKEIASIFSSFSDTARVNSKILSKVQHGATVEVDGIEKNLTAEPNFSCDFHYANTNLFSMNLEVRLRQLLKVKSIQDIEAMVSNVAKTTGAPENTVKEVLAGLTQFAEYSQLNVIEKKLGELGIGYIRVPKEIGLNINSVLHYLESKKKQIDLGYLNAKEALFLDETVLSYLKDLKDKAPLDFRDLKEEIDRCKVKVFHLSGWNNVIDGQDISHGFLGHQIDLESSAIAVINKMKKEGISLEEALNGDFLRRAKGILGEETEITVIENRKAPTLNNIADNLNSLYPSHKRIKAVIDTIIEQMMPASHYSVQEITKGRELIAKYFEAMLSCHSSETMTDMLKNKFAEIKNIVQKQGKSSDDVLYVIPARGKSFELVTYQYVNINKINPKKIIYFNGREDPPVDLNDKILVILDDIVGSGASIVQEEFSYGSFVNNPDIKNTGIIFSPISSLRSGIENVYNEMVYLNRAADDFFIPGTTVDYRKFANTLTKEEQNLLAKLLGDFGYGDGYACTSVPYMLPDNNTMASGLLLKYCINNIKGSKCSDWFHSFKSLIEQKMRMNT